MGMLAMPLVVKSPLEEGGGEGAADEVAISWWPPCEEWLPARRRRAESLESRRAWSRCLLSSRCSGVIIRGLLVIDRE